MITIQYKISGKVQGVAYRAFARDSAQKHGIVGWVRNLQDGSVECLACAEEQDLELFEVNLMQGPQWAKVDRIKKVELTEACEIKKFEVRY